MESSLPPESIQESEHHHGEAAAAAAPEGAIVEHAVDGVSGYSERSAVAEELDAVASSEQHSPDAVARENQQQIESQAAAAELAGGSRGRQGEDLLGWDAPAASGSYDTSPEANGGVNNEGEQDTDIATAGDAVPSEPANSHDEAAAANNDAAGEETQ
jgi:hypothetical protein